MKVIDLHCDTLYECTVKNKSLYKNDLHISFEKALNYDKYLQCFAVWMPDEFRGRKAVEHFDKCLSCFNSQTAEHSDIVKVIRFNDELDDYLKGDKPLGALLTVEGGSALAGKIENIDYLFDCGVRIMTLTWNADNEIAGGVAGSGGLTEFGKKAISQMEQKGIIVDVSHLNDRSFDEIMDVVRKPVVATHSNLRSVCSHARNLTDDRLKKIIDGGGIVGLNFYRAFLGDNSIADIDSIYRMVDAFMERGGQDFLCMGSDFDGCDLPDGISGILDMKRIYDYLLARGYDESVLEDVFYNNAKNFLLKHLPWREI